MNHSPSDEKAMKLAQAFRRWRELDKQLTSDPSAVPPEQIGEAWDAVEQAYEEWVLSE